MADNQSAKPRTGLSLYANLLDPSSDSAPGTISRAPVVFKQPASDEVRVEEASPPEKTQISAGR
jgi:splicing factor 45